MAKLNTYVANGTIHLAPNFYIDVNDIEVQAYSSKQARLKVAFRVKEQLNDNVTVQAIYKALKHVSIVQR